MARRPVVDSHDTTGKRELRKEEGNTKPVRKMVSRMKSAMSGCCCCFGGVVSAVARREARRGRVTGTAVAKRKSKDRATRDTGAQYEVDSIITRWTRTLQLFRFTETEAS